ncbi:response regulator transcription factor [Pseudobacteroides cellulosolvens]|uniref:Stage 0 sporulation protein A homolog n=1 Tax=Pseudobacteroides cellulosolvens ATCC 35603 = DSM 2933 TaxID=398512 RepID=A0A0L6JUH7_9FIRM|nr:response regulator transcription factor [Pseudobacteroides cellulosolvens]KNY29374.1 two component transcriptional regulator, LuxR family [Pseudobacteroides cellulosolvens ATCC 35603 = DSM 2933]
MSRIKVAIVDDDHSWINAMVSFLKRHLDIDIVGTAESKSEAINIVKSVEIDVLLMDINLNGNMCDGIYAVSEIVNIKPLKVIMLTSLNSDEIIRDSFTAGAINFVLKDNYEDIPTLIRKCFKDKTPIEVVLEEYKKFKRDEQLKDLTSSEREVFSYLEKGYTYTQIQETLFKSHNTIKTQVRSILSKMNVKSYKEAIKKVRTGGLRIG